MRKRVTHPDRIGQILTWIVLIGLVIGLLWALYDRRARMLRAADHLEKWRANGQAASIRYGS